MLVLPIASSNATEARVVPHTGCPALQVDGQFVPPVAGIHVAAGGTEEWFYHHHFCPNTCYFIADTNLLNPGDDTEGVFSRYSRDTPEEPPAIAVVCSHPNAAAAAEDTRVALVFDAPTAAKTREMRGLPLDDTPKGE